MKRSDILRMNKITTRHIQKFINNLSENGINQKTGKGLAPKTICNTVVLFLVFLNMLSE